MSKSKYTSIGGQALIEGVMMKGPEETAISVRNSEGVIITETEPTKTPKDACKILGWPIIRGVANMVANMIEGVRYLYKSIELSGMEDEIEEPQTKFEKWLDRVFGEKIYSAVMALGTVLGVVLSVGLFILLPMYLVRWLEDGMTALGWIEAGGLGLWKNLLEGLIKIGVFVAYLASVSSMKEMRRVFEYHGAEHKSIACFEAGELLTPENAKKYRRFHPRCGTSFLFVVLVISILISCLIQWDLMWLRFTCKILLLPLTMGIGYEFIRFTGKYDNKLTRLLVQPGLLMQRLTTKEPDESQLEVAIASLIAALPEEERSKYSCDTNLEEVAEASDCPSC